jgi:probable F420-dependent oxidoreductase
MASFRVGVQLQPQHTTIDDLRRAWREADQLGLDSIWTWDHFFPLYGPDDGGHFEGWSLLAALAADTSNANFGMLVTCNTYRNPDLLADIARTVDHISGGRLYLGIGAGWFERDYTEYGYDFGTPSTRLKALEAAVPRIKRRLKLLNPPPAGRLPILIAGGGEKVTLRIVAAEADAWNTFGPVENFAHKNRVLDEWCAKIGRDPVAIERTVLIGANEIERADDYVAAGADHLLISVEHPYNLDDAERLLALSRADD